MKMASGDRTNFHMNCFARRLVLTKRQKATWQWAKGKLRMVVRSRMQSKEKDSSKTNLMTLVVLQ